MKIQDRNVASLIKAQSCSGQMDAQLRRHAKQLIRQQEELLKQRMQKQQQKQEKIKQIEVNFVKWVQNKNQIFLEKHDKVEKNKKEEIKKIVKRCHDRDKYVIKKHQDYKIMKKKKMNIDWKKAQKFNQDIQTYYRSKQFMSKTLKSGQSGQSLHFNREPEQEDIKEMKKSEKTIMNQSLVFMNSSSKIQNTINNQSSFFNMTQYQQKNESIPLKNSQKNFYTQNLNNTQDSQDYKDKFLQAMEKKKQKQKNDQLQKIQHLGTKYSKIQQSRSRKKQIQDKKFSKNSPQRERNLTSYESDGRINKVLKKNNKKSYEKTKISSEEAWRRQSRIRDRTFQGKQRRQQMLDKHLEEGDEYLQNLRVKHLKTVLAKNIAFNAMERKLYLQRLKN